MSKGFSYVLEDDKIVAYMKLSTEDKLNWLEEINRFNRMFLTDKEREISRRLMQGEHSIEDHEKR
ncbi:MAG: hypothetical protein HY886_00620 [Deltaproteobacteria bacterium]|nr:hypothetical protein [Deltaproteobacteria bacterium]